jgi:hypothetical protein
MRRTQLAEDSQTFVDCAEAILSSVGADSTARRRLENARRKLIRSLIRVCKTLDDHEICSVAEYVLLITT